MDRHIIRKTEEYIPDPQEDIIEEVPSPEEPVVITDAASDRNVTLFRTYQVMWFILGAIETVLVFRFLFRFLGANPLSPFVTFIYNLSALFVAPFNGILPPITNGFSVFEWSTLVAMVVYLVLTYGIFEALRLFIPIRSASSSKKRYSSRRTRYAI